MDMDRPMLKDLIDRNRSYEWAAMLEQHFADEQWDAGGSDRVTAFQAYRAHVKARLDTLPKEFKITLGAGRARTTIALQEWARLVNADDDNYDPPEMLPHRDLLNWAHRDYHEELRAFLDLDEDESFKTC